MSAPPILDSETLSDEDKHLIATFDDIEAKQPELLDQTGKRIIELATDLQAVFLAIDGNLDIANAEDRFPQPAHPCKAFGLDGLWGVIGDQKENKVSL